MSNKSTVVVTMELQPSSGVEYDVIYCHLSSIDFIDYSHIVLLKFLWYNCTVQLSAFFLIYYS